MKKGKHLMMEQILYYHYDVLASVTLHTYHTAVFAWEVH
jgi:hypothetical protein